MELHDLIVDLERRYPPSTAAEWDAVGLVAGDPAQPVSRILLAVEATEATVAQAEELGVDLLLVHHPLLLRGVHTVATTTARGRVLTRLIRAGIALYTAHTNADDAAGGVSEALALGLGLRDLRPLVPSSRPGAAEGTGTGRVGVLDAPIGLRDLAERVASAVPTTAQGVRYSGPADALVATVAVCGGSGDGFLAAARTAGVDAYVTADLRHHPATDYRAEGERPYLVDAAHWASEWPWLPVLADQLRADAAARGTTVEVSVSELRTDAWTEAVTGAELAAGAAPVPTA